MLTIYSLVTFALLWTLFGVTLLVNRGWLDQLWEWLRGLPSIVEVIVWVAFTPITVALWTWQAAWPLPIRLLGFAAIVLWTLAAISSFLRLVRSG